MELVAVPTDMRAVWVGENVLHANRCENKKCVYCVRLSDVRCLLCVRVRVLCACDLINVMGKSW